MLNRMGFSFNRGGNDGMKEYDEEQQINKIQILFLQRQQLKISLLIEASRSKIKIILKERQNMTSSCPTYCPKFAKPISKGNKTWRKVNKLACRLSNKGVPSTIVDMVDSVSQITLSNLSSMNFERGVSVQQMSALAKIQSIEALTLNLDYQMDMELRKRESQITETSEGSSECSIKQNLENRRMETHYQRPQDAEAVFE